MAFAILPCGGWHAIHRDSRVVRIAQYRVSKSQKFPETSVTSWTHRSTAWVWQDNLFYFNCLLGISAQVDRFFWKKLLSAAGSWRCKTGKQWYLVDEKFVGARISIKANCEGKRKWNPSELCTLKRQKSAAYRRGSFSKTNQPEHYCRANIRNKKKISCHTQAVRSAGSSL